MFDVEDERRRGRQMRLGWLQRRERREGVRLSGRKREKEGRKERREQKAVEWLSLLLLLLKE